MTTTSRAGAKPAGMGDERVIGGLNTCLGNLIDLHWQAKQAHWNVIGPNFIAVHELFDAQATMARGMADLVAERARALDGAAEGTIRFAVDRSSLEEFPHGLVQWQAAITALVERYEWLSAQFKAASDVAAEAEDKGTEDLYVEMIRQIDEAAYFLRAHLD